MARWDCLLSLFYAHVRIPYQLDVRKKPTDFQNFPANHFVHPQKGMVGKILKVRRLFCRNMEVGRLFFVMTYKSGDPISSF